MKNKKLENAILTIKNYCKNHDCNDCEMRRTCKQIGNVDVPLAWEIKE